MSKSAPKIPQVSTEVNDLVETSELLRATHTLVRQAFGAVVIYKDVLNVSSESLKDFAEHLDKVTSFLRSRYSAFVSLIDQKKHEKGTRETN